MIMAKVTNIKDYMENKEDEARKSYKIGRNQPCPCGSGKKYKKCCDRITPEKSKEYYQEKIKEEKDEGQVFELLQEADKDYPMDPAFTLPIIVYSLQKQDRNTARQYLKKAWEIMGADLDDVFIMPLINLLLEKGNVEKAETIINKALDQKGDSPRLLISRGEVLKVKGNIRETFQVIEKGLEIEPENIELIVFKMETLMDINNLLSALEVWYNNFDLLQQVQGVYVLKFLRKLLVENFGLPRDTNAEETKAVLEKAIDANRLWEDVYELIGNRQIEEVKNKLEDIKRLIPANSKLVTNIMDNYFSINALNQVIEYGEKCERHHEENPDFNQVMAAAFFEKEQIETAGDYIKKSYQLVKENAESEDKDFDRWDIAGDYLRYILEKDDDTALIEFIEELAELAPEGETLISTLEMSLNKYDLETYPTKLLLKLKQMKDHHLIDVRELYITYLFILLSYLDRAEMKQEKQLSAMKETLYKEINEIQDRDITSPLVKYTILRLESDQLSEGEIKRAVEKILDEEASYPQESIAKYETLLKFGDPALILDNKLDTENLSDEYINFYRLAAAIKVKRLDQASQLFYQVAMHKMQQGNIGDLLLRLSLFIDRNKMLEVLKDIEVPEDIIDMLKEINTYLDSRN